MERGSPEEDAGKGVDLVIETGGAGTFARSLNTAAFDGTVFAMGFLSGSIPTIDVLPIFQKRLNVQGANTSSISDLEDATPAIAAAKIRFIIDRTLISTMRPLPLSNSRQADVISES